MDRALDRRARARGSIRPELVDGRTSAPVGRRKPPATTSRRPRRERRADVSQQGADVGLLGEWCGRRRWPLAAHRQNFIPYAYFVFLKGAVSWHGGSCVNRGPEPRRPGVPARDRRAAGSALSAGAAWPGRALRLLLGAVPPRARDDGRNRLLKTDRLFWSRKITSQRCLD